MVRRWTVPLFLLLAYGLSWGLFALGYWGLHVSSPLGWTGISAFFMFGPALAALALRKRAGMGWKDLGITFQGIRWGWFGIAVGIALALPPLTLAFNRLLEALHVAGTGHTAVTKAMMLDTLSDRLDAAGVTDDARSKMMGFLRDLPLTGPMMLAVALLIGALAGCTVNLVFALGEELGWRGFLLQATRTWSFPMQVLFTGIVWGLWHAPLILHGHNYPHHPWSGVAFMCLLTLGLAGPLAWVRLRSGCIWSAAAFHGTVNGTAGAALLFIRGSDEFVGSPVGIAGLLALLVVNVLLLLSDRSFLRTFHP